MYFANPTGGAVAEMREGRIGFIDTPKQGNKRPHGVVWCADNGCFGKGYEESHWWAWLEGNAADAQSCMFATAPDVVGDAAATLERATPWLPRIRALGYPAAFVAQDGQENLPLPWDMFDVLFIGGSTEFKLLHHEDAIAGIKALNDPTLSRAEKDKVAFEQNRNLKWLNLMWQVRAHGKAIHVGRVNSFERMAIANTFGAESADGTFLVFGPDTNLPKMKKWQEKFVNYTRLADAIKSGGPIPPEMQKTYDKMTGVKPKRGRKTKAAPAPNAAGTGAAAGFAAPRVPGEVFRILAARGVEAARDHLADCDPADLRDLAAFLVRAVGSQTTLAVPAAALLPLVREAVEAAFDLAGFGDGTLAARKRAEAAEEIRKAEGGGGG